MLILRLKRAESAIADNRLDEAFDIVQSEDIRQHRRGQKLIGKLARAFSKRGQENLKAERLQLALIDCNKTFEDGSKTDKRYIFSQQAISNNRQDRNPLAKRQIVETLYAKVIIIECTHHCFVEQRRQGLGK